MFRIGHKYKIELRKGIFYTGIILSEDSISIILKSIKNEEIIIKVYFRKIKDERGFKKY